MEAIYIQSCSNDSELLRHYAKRAGCWQKAGRKIRRALHNLQMEFWFKLNLENMKRGWFEVERFRYDNQLYACATNSGINYLFLITKNN